MNDVYDKQALIKDLGLFGLMVLALYVTRGSGFLLFAFLILTALLQNKCDKIMVYMMICSAALIGNYALMPKDTIFSISQKVMMLVMSLVLVTKTAGKKHSPMVTPLMGMFIYILYMAVISFQGWNPMISCLKIILFSSCYFAFYGFAVTMINDRKISIRTIRSAYLALDCFLLLGSILIMPFPAISQLRAEQYLEAMANGMPIHSLFCGMLFHSQALGPLVATLFVLLLSDLVFCVRKPNKLMILLLACCPILIYKTSSRTAMGTFLVGGFFVIYLFMQSRGVGRRWKGKVVSTFMLLTILGSAAVLASSSGRESLAKYVLKNDEATTLEGVGMETVLVTRQGLMDSALANFREKPMFGNGFQVSEKLIGYGKNGLRDVLTAPVEKGVWITAVLEEGGAIGMFIFVCFAISALCTLVHRKAYTTASVLLTILILNLGEFTMFSMSGIGGFYWCICFVGAILDAYRLRMQNEHPMVAWR